MRLFEMRGIGATKGFGALCIAFITASMFLPALGQGQMEPPAQISGVTMSIFPVERGADNLQYITTPKGFKVTVPGLGIAPDAHEVAVYRNNANQFWYIDQKGATQPVSASQLQWTLAQINQQETLRNIESGGAGIQPGRPEMPIENRPGMPMGVQPGMMQPGMMQTMPMQGQVMQQTPTVVVQNQQPTGAASAAMVGGLAAATGAMAGTAIASSMYGQNKGYCGIPYGAPCYGNAGHYYYHGADGIHEIPANANNHYMDQWNHQQQYQNNSQDRHNAYNNLNGNQQQMLKNESDVRTEQRRSMDSEVESHGGSREEGNQLTREGRRFRR